MDKFIERITTVIPFTNEPIDIVLGGKNLILTGANGSGKTSLLRDIYAKLKIIIVNKQFGQHDVIKKNVKHFQDQVMNVITRGF